MVGARLLTESLLHVPLLVHLDAVLRHLKKATSKSRPDFVGYDPVAGTYSLAVEAKGRSGAMALDALATAKAQALKLPTVVNTTTTITAASLTYFENGHWNAHLEDPPRLRTQTATIPPGLLVATYYLPLVEALTEFADGRLDVTDSQVYGDLREAGLTLVLPRFIFEPLASLPPRARVEPDELAGAGDRIATTWKQALSEDQRRDGHVLPTLPRPSVLDLDEKSSDWDATTHPGVEDSDPEQGSWTGIDLISVLVDDDWPGGHQD